MEETRSLADGDEEEDEEEEDMSPQKLRTMIKEGIEVLIFILNAKMLTTMMTTIIKNMETLTTMMTRTTQRKVLCFPLLPTVVGDGSSVLLPFAQIW